jgi:hypothetical protein
VSTRSRRCPRPSRPKPSPRRWSTSAFDLEEITSALTDAVSQYVSPAVDDYGSDTLEHLGRVARNGVNLAQNVQGADLAIVDADHESADPDPTDSDFGATVFASDPGSEGGSWPLGAAHSEYFDDGSASLEYMGEVIAGQR